MIKLQRLLFHPDQFQENLVTLNPEQKRYLTRVLRLKVMDQFIAMDGIGHWWRAMLTGECATATLLEQLEVDNELSLEVTLVAAPPKGKGFDEVIHGATELGVRHIYPLISERTQVRPSDQKLSRWQKIAVEAAEQSLRQFVPVVHSPIPIQGLHSEIHSSSVSLVLFCSTQSPRVPLAHVLRDLRGDFQQVMLITGPEGGWSPQEEDLCSSAQWTAVSLGKRVLRAVTAPICALSLIAGWAETFQPAP